MQTVDRKLLRFAWLAGASVVFTAVIPSVTRAMTEKDYLKALSIAEQKVERTRAASTASALSSSIIKAYFGRYYKVGDSWDVAAWRLKSPLMSVAPVPEGQAPKTTTGGIFRYTVKDVRNGATPQVVISVKQISEFGMKPVDKKVDELVLTMSDRFVQTEKEYRIHGRATPVKVSPNGVHSWISPLELFPLDVPNIATAVKNPPSSMPTLPESVQKLATQVGYHPLLNESTWLEQDDFFGRPVQILWQYGNPWPSYLKTDDGIAILIRRKAS